MFKTILFPVDQSRETGEAAEVVVNLVQNYQSKLILPEPRTVPLISNYGDVVR